MHYLLNIRLIPRRYWFRANTRVRRRQVDSEASGRRHCLCINWWSFRMSGHITSFITDCCWRFSFTIDCRSRRNVSLCIEILSIGIWLRNECWTAACWTMKKFQQKSLRALIREYLRHSGGSVVLCCLIMTWTWCIVHATWPRRRTRLVATLRYYYFCYFFLYFNRVYFVNFFFLFAWRLSRNIFNKNLIVWQLH